MGVAKLGKTLRRYWQNYGQSRMREFVYRRRRILFFIVDTRATIFIKMNSKIKKARKPNFMDEEIRCLLERIGQEKEPIQCKLQGRLTGRLKKEAWSCVLMRVNSDKTTTFQFKHIYLLTWNY